MAKKIISLIIVLSIVASFSITTYSKQSNTENIEKMYEILKGLEIIHGDEYEGYGSYRNISKSAFINFICNMLDDYGFTEKHNDDAIKIAEEKGIIHKNQDDLNKSLYYDEAMTMAVRLLGYGMHAEESGGFPIGYISIANRLGLNDGIVASSGERLKEFEAITLLYNMINCPYVEIVSVTDDGIVYGNTSDKTFLYEYRNIYRIEGILESTDTITYRTTSEVGEDKVMIGGYIYNADEDFSDFVGMNVEAYIKEAKNDDDAVMYMFPSNNKEMIVQCDDIVDISDNFGKFEYVGGNDKITAINLSPTLTVIYNGQPFKGYKEEDFKPEDGNVRFIDNDGKNGYDVVYITEYKTIIVNTVSVLNDTISNTYTYDEDNLSLDISENNEDEAAIYNSNGEKLRIEDILNGTVIKVAKSVVDGRKAVKGFLSDSTVTGVVTELKASEDIILTINENQYALSETYEQALSKKEPKAMDIKVGMSYVFYLDSDGEIAYATNVGDGLRYGLVYGTRTDGVFAADCYIKLFTSEGKWSELGFEQKIRYNDESGVRPENILDEIATAVNGEMCIVSYKLNDRGKIISLDTAEAYNNGNEGRFNEYDPKVVTGGETYTFRSNNSSFDHKLFTETDSICFIVNGEAVLDENSYTVGKADMLVGDTAYVVKGYNVDEFGFADIFLIKAVSGNNSMYINNTSIFLVESISDVLSSDGDIVKAITGMKDRFDSITYLCDDPEIYEDIRSGDIMSLHTDHRGYIDQKITYRPYTDDVTYGLTNAAHARPSLVEGVVEKNDAANTRLKIDIGSGYHSVRTNAETNVFIYYRDKKEVARGTINDIEKGDAIFAKIVMSTLYGFVIFR